MRQSPLGHLLQDAAILSPSVHVHVLGTQSTFSFLLARERTSSQPHAIQLRAFLEVFGQRCFKSAPADVLSDCVLAGLGIASAAAASHEIFQFLNDTRHLWQLCALRCQDVTQETACTPCQLSFPICCAFGANSRTHNHLQTMSRCPLHRLRADNTTKSCASMSADSNSTLGTSSSIASELTFFEDPAAQSDAVRTCGYVPCHDVFDLSSPHAEIFFSA